MTKPSLPGRGGPGSLGIVVPTLDEAATLPLLLDDLAGLRADGATLVVSDGGSTDGTPVAAQRSGALLALADGGRGPQLAAGVRVLEALPGGPPPWLLLLHADSRLPPETLALLRQTLGDPGVGGAFHFAFRLQGSGAWFRALEAGQRVRQALTGLAYGDQGLLVRRTLLQEAGGIPELPIMEDVALLRALRRTGPVRSLRAPVLTSPRRYRTEGQVRGWLRNAALITLFGLGVPAERLARWYPPHAARRPTARRHAAPPGASPPDAAHRPPRRSASPDRTLAIFLKAPDPGQVKTRLARSVGDREAVRLYDQMARGVVTSLRDGPWRTTVHHAPPGACARIARWLEPDPEEARRPLLLRPQAPGDLGARMLHALEGAATEVGHAHPVVIVGTDAPGLGPALVEEAFRALEGDPDAGLPPADLVLVPALDGGYALIGQRRPAPALFRRVPWSTPRVLPLTLERAREAGLRVCELEPVLDIDDARDLARARAQGLLDPLPPGGPPDLAGPGPGDLPRGAG